MVEEVVVENENEVESEIISDPVDVFNDWVHHKLEPLVFEKQDLELLPRRFHLRLTYQV